MNISLTAKAVSTVFPPRESRDEVTKLRLPCGHHDHAETHPETSAGNACSLGEGTEASRSVRASGKTERV